MKAEFIPYQQALQLKELNFDIPSISGYSYPNSLDLLGDAILYQQAFRWFRDKHNLAVQFNYYHIPKWTYEILEFTDLKMTPNKIACECTIPRTYEEVEQACLDKLIEIIKNKIEKL
jgi:hypothetical protein